MKNWLLILVILESVALGILGYAWLRPKPATVEQYKYDQLQSQKDSLKIVIDNIKLDTVVMPVDDSLVIQKMNTILYELRKKQKPVVVDTFGSAAIVKYFSELPD